ncbi:hypothetical protein BT67DRAFT_461453 [Trichocladium antarcticum]|uniref:FAD-binding PCMH-type domain-containing protein n=1 Tax=Trichocladium antarcticum TaxID=1450529 RepID=A0AAN6UN28_9PEZI|nr:hypothetical protein BT67DRAFT_461453 [Trichocladium antarcticum]
MATLDALKLALRQKHDAMTAPSSPKQPLSDAQYSAGFDTLLRSSGWTTYQDFIIPQLSQLLGPLFDSRAHISVLEIGPGPQTVLAHLPTHQQDKITQYTAFEPNQLFASRLKLSLCTPADNDNDNDNDNPSSPLPSLTRPPTIHPTNIPPNPTITPPSQKKQTFDLILLCHSMYGMHPKRPILQHALHHLHTTHTHDTLALVVVVHRGTALPLDSGTALLPHHTAVSLTGAIRVPADDDGALDRLAPFIAGFVAPDAAVRGAWRGVCRALGRRGGKGGAELVFAEPNVMVAFSRYAGTALSELSRGVVELGVAAGGVVVVVKNREARRHCPAAVVRPGGVREVQECVWWARRNGVGLTVVGGGHGGQCLWPGVVAVDMGAFDRASVVAAAEGAGAGTGTGALVVAGAGCKTGDIIRTAMAAGLTVPLGARPSVGAGLWLQGGIGHLARLHGLACDAVVGAVVVSVESGQLLCVGCVPSQHRPAGAVECRNDDDLLWAIRGGGTNFGIVVSVTFKAYAAPTYLVRNWFAPLGDRLESQAKLNEFDKSVARQLPRNCSADAYLYADNNCLHLGVTIFESTTANGSETPMPTRVSEILGQPASSEVVDSVGVFDSEMYMSGLHGGHGGGKTSSFKRCLFLKDIGQARIADALMQAVEARPTPLCYLHLLHGGGAVNDVPADDTAFGCRDWDFACVITGVWPRDQDGTEAAAAAVRWVYRIAGQLLPLSSGAYGADLGPDPRDAALAAKAFGPNLARLARLKHDLDPRRMLAYACPLPRAPMEPKLIILVTGESGAGKDYCADVWASEFTDNNFTARVVSIGDTTRREYAAATGADLGRLLEDRVYKEQHRPALTSFFHDQQQQRPRLPQEHFLKAVYSAAGADVLLITGMKDEAPVAAFAHLVPDSRLIEVRVEASPETRLHRRRLPDTHTATIITSNTTNPLPAPPTFTFPNNAPTPLASYTFATISLLPLLHPSLTHLTTLARPIPDFPTPGITFRHVLNIAQAPYGLALCSRLLQQHVQSHVQQTQQTPQTQQAPQIACVVSVEAGGWVFASALAAGTGVPLVLVRAAGRLPAPVVGGVGKGVSHISGVGRGVGAGDTGVEGKEGDGIEMGVGAVPGGDGRVVVVDDVLATGRTLCAVLRLLGEAGVDPQRLGVVVVAEFPTHRGRELLRRAGFGGVDVRSLLVFGGV